MEDRGLMGLAGYEWDVGRKMTRLATVGSWVGGAWLSVSPDSVLGRWTARLVPHRVALLIVGICAVVGQAATLTQRPLVALYPDTRSYLQSAQQIAGSFDFVQTFRAPGYPSFLAAVFGLTGGVDYNQAATCTTIVSSGYCQQALRLAVVAQASVALLVTLGIYVLIYRLTHRRMTACVVAALLALNLYVLAWERNILSEFLSYASLVGVFLCYERFVCGPRTRMAVMLGLSLFVAIMVRPFNIYLPLLLLGLFAMRLVWTKRWRAEWRPLVISAAVVFSTLLGYMLINTISNDFVGLTWEQNVTLLGKVMEYHMEGMATDPKYQPIQADAVVFVNSGGVDPWRFGDFHPAYAANGYQAAGAFARSIILHHPLTYFKRSAPDFLRTWLAIPSFYAPTNTVSDGGAVPHDGPVWGTTGLLDLSRIEEGTFLLLPWLLALIANRLRHRPRDVSAFMLFALLVAVVSGIALASAGNYAEYYRVRSPVDWGMIAVSLVVELEVVYFALNRIPWRRTPVLQ